MANTTIQLKFSTVASNTPSSLANGEIAINGADGKLFYRTPSGTIQSIVTYPGPAGLNKEIQFNDSGVAGSNSALTFDKASASLNVTNINVTTRITTGGGAGGTIAGANAIFANSFIANTGGITTAGNSSLNGIVTVNYINATSTSNVAIEMYGANTKGGTGYFDFIAANNRSAGTTNPNKWFRLDSTGQFQIINSAYTDNIFNLDNSGNVTIPGFLRTATGYVQFADGTKQYTANAGGSQSNTQILAGLQTVSNTANITFDWVATANNGQGTNFKVGDDVWIGDINVADTMGLRGQQNVANAYIVFGNSDSTSKLGRAGLGPLTYAGNIVWHAGNDGSGSGLDADLLDGLNSASFANTAYTQAAFDKANSAATVANTDYTLISTTAGVYGNAAFVPVATLTANGRVSSITNTAIAIDTAAITSGTLADARLPTKGTAGTYGNTTYLPVITTDAYGRVTAVTNTAISFPTATDTLQTVTTRGSTTANAISITNTTSSTSKTTGALIVAGGVGVAGDLFAGNSIVVDGGSYGNVTTTQFASVYGQASGPNAYSIMQVRSNDFKTGMGMQTYAGLNGLVYSNTGIQFNTSAIVRDKDFPTGGTNAGQFAANGAFIAQASLASTSNATGSIQVVGGVGVKGNVIADNVYVGANPVATIPDVLALAIALG